MIISHTPKRHGRINLAMDESRKQGVSLHCHNNTMLTELRKIASVTDIEINKITDLLKTKLSTGLDEITTKMVKFCSKELLQPTSPVCPFNKEYSHTK